MQLNWRITANDIKQARIKYSNKCPMLKHNSNQQALWKLYAIEIKSNQPGLVTNLVNAYTRDRISFKNKTKHELSISKWVSKSSLIKKLTKNENYKMDIISSAIKTFFTRFNNKISFNAIEKTQDLAEPYAEYIYDITCFINKLITQDKNHKNDKINKYSKPIVPFQIDLWIKHSQNSENTNNSEDELSDDENENEDEEKMNYDNININITDRLNSNKIIYKKHENIPKKKNEKTERIIRRLFEELRQCKNNGKELNLIDFMRGNRFVIIVERNDINDEYVIVSDDDKYVMISHNNKDKINNKPVPKMKEIRTKPVNRTQYGDTIYLFQPNKGYKIPMQYCNETFLQLSCDCVLPGMDNNGKITAKTASNNFFMISWHVKQMNEVSCYQYQRGQINKFIPSDMADLWPYFFDSCSGINDEFFKKQRDENNMNSYVKKTKIIDNKFEGFCKIGYEKNNKSFD